MEELEVVLLNQPNSHYHVLQYPLNDVRELRKHYQLSAVTYGSLSYRFALAYTQSGTDLLPPAIEFDGTSVPNRTYMCAATL